MKQPLQDFSFQIEAFHFHFHSSSLEKRHHYHRHDHRDVWRQTSVFFEKCPLKDGTSSHIVSSLLLLRTMEVTWERRPRERRRGPRSKSAANGEIDEIPHGRLAMVWQQKVRDIKRSLGTVKVFGARYVEHCWTSEVGWGMLAKVLCCCNWFLPRIAVPDKSRCFGLLDLRYLNNPQYISIKVWWIQR